MQDGSKVLKGLGGRLVEKENGGVSGGLCGDLSFQHLRKAREKDLLVRD